jgi:DNA-binding NtrC family response regulator
MSKILIVDSHKGVQKLVSSIIIDFLQDIEPMVSCSGNGEEALGLIEKEPIDLLITGVEIPPSNGLVLAAKVKAVSPATAIILMSALPEPEGSVADAFASKPFEIDALVKTIRRLLKK